MHQLRLSDFTWVRRIVIRGLTRELKVGARDIREIADGFSYGEVTLSAVLPA